MHTLLPLAQGSAPSRVGHKRPAPRLRVAGADALDQHQGCYVCGGGRRVFPAVGFLQPYVAVPRGPSPLLISSACIVSRRGTDKSVRVGVASPVSRMAGFEQGAGSLGPLAPSALPPHPRPRVLSRVGGPTGFPPTNDLARGIMVGTSTLRFTPPPPPPRPPPTPTPLYTFASCKERPFYNKNSLFGFILTGHTHPGAWRREISRMVACMSAGWFC